MDRPHRLRVEHLDDPIGLTVARPRLSWRLPSGSRHQAAYQVRMGAWDSGQVESSSSVLVDVGAPPLRSRERITWQVRVWTDLGCSPWSATAKVETGLLDAADWSASWIEPAEDIIESPGCRPARLLRKVVTLPDQVESARAYVTAHGIYELFVNGTRAGDAELTPGFTDYPSRLQVQTYDLGSLLHEGDNVVAAVLSDGWFRGINGMFRDADCYGTRTALLMQLHAHLEGGAEVVTGTDATWRSNTGSIVAADLMDGTTVDLRLEQTGWDTPKYDDGAWQSARIADLGYANLASSPAPPVRRTELRRPLKVTRAPSGAQVVDMGENIVGWVRLSELGPEGNQTTLTFSEALSPEGEASQRNLQPDHMPPGEAEVPVGQVDHVISKGREGEIFEPRHSTKGFRYVGVQGAARDLTPDDVTGVVVNTDLRRTGTFRCSNESLNALHRAAERSFLGNAVDIPTDCPTRERSGWTGDWAVFAPSAAFLFDVAGFSEKWLTDLASQQFDDGVVPNWVPDPLGPSIRQHPLLGPNLGSAGWGDAAVIVPWEMYLAYGDRGLLERQWPSMVAWVERAIQMSREGRHSARAAARPTPLPHEEFLWDTGFHFGEWLEPGVQIGWDELKTADFSAVSTAYLRLSAGLLSRVASVLGNEAAAERYRRISDAVRSAWQAEFVTDAGTVVPETQATLVRALAFDLVDVDLRATMAGRLVELIRAADTHLGTGFLATPHLLPTLAQAGHLDVAYELLLQNSPPSWLHMLDQGATTVWELWEAIDKDGVAHESLNHYSKGAVIGFLHRYVAGLQLADTGPGYQHFRVQPHPGGGLSSAEVVHESPYGPIEVSWRLDADTLRVRVVAPAGTTADVVMPDGRGTTVGPGTSIFDSALPPRTVSGTYE